MLLRLAYPDVTNVFAFLRLLLVSGRDKDVETLVLRHQIMVLERQLGKARPRFCASDRVFLAALLHLWGANTWSCAVSWGFLQDCKGDPSLLLNAFK